jgi:MFS transporter, DHA2 family, multidrug resistance protein
VVTLQRPQLRRAWLNGVPRAAAPAPASLVEYGARRWIVVAGVMLAALLQTIDTTIVNVALPTIQGNLGASVDEGTWVVTAYVIANVVVIPMTPWLQRRFGRKNYFIASILGFTAASLLCGFATTLPELILFRIVQGAFGGGLLSTAQLVMRDTFPADQLGTSQSIFAFATIIGPSVGPTLGGIITDNLSWQWVFDINLVPGVLSAILLWLFLRDNTPAHRERVDLGGIALLIVSVASLQYVLDQGQMYDWFSDSRIVTATWVALVGGACFVWWELKSHAPIVDVRILRYRAVVIAVLTLVVNAVGTFGVLLLLPQFTVDQLGFTSTQAGMLIGARALPIALLTMPIGRLVNSNRIDLRVLIGGGLFIAGVGTLWLSQRITAQSDFLSFIPPLVFSGVGIACIYSPALVATLRAVPLSEAPKVSSLIILSFQLGGSIAAASLVVLTDRREQFHQAILAGQMTLQRPGIASFLQSHPVSQLTAIVASQATVMAYADALMAAGCIAACFSPFVAFLSQKGQKA